MMTVHEVSKLAGVSIRTLQYYDKIGLLHPSKYSDAGYRLYTDTDLERLQQILLFRELEFSLKDIREILESPDFDRNKALDQQITLLKLKKEHLENLINFATGIKLLGVKYINFSATDFSAFDKSRLDEYATRAKAAWGNSPEYKEYEEKAKNRTPEEDQILNRQCMMIFREFGEIKDTDPSSEAAQALVIKLQSFLTEHFYKCTDKILSGLGKMYAGGGEFTKSIDEYAGEGTAVFVNEAIQTYCG